jgi:hypothetical protein
MSSKHRNIGSLNENSSKCSGFREDFSKFYIKTLFIISRRVYNSFESINNCPTKGSYVQLPKIVKKSTIYN